MPFSLLLRTPLFFSPLTDHLQVLMNRVNSTVCSFHTRRDQAQLVPNLFHAVPKYTEAMSDLCTNGERVHTHQMYKTLGSTSEIQPQTPSVKTP